MSGFGGAGAFSDGKYNITNDFGGTLYEHIGKKEALDLMRYVDDINVAYGGQDTKMYSTAGTKFKKLCMQNKLKLLDASVRHLGTDINYVVLENLYSKLKEHVDFYFNTPVERLEVLDDGYRIVTKNDTTDCSKCIVSVGRSGSKWMEQICKELDIPDVYKRQVVKLLEYITYKYRYRKVKYHLHWFPNCHVCLHSNKPSQSFFNPLYLLFSISVLSDIRAIIVEKIFHFKMCFLIP